MARMTLDRIDQKLSDVKELLERHVQAFQEHTHRDREDFDKITAIVNSLRRWQSWVVGVGTASILILTWYISWAC